jgi:hypothetical protein
VADQPVGVGHVGFGQAKPPNAAPR